MECDSYRNYSHYYCSTYEPGCAAVHQYAKTAQETREYNRSANTYEAPTHPLVIPSGGTVSCRGTLSCYPLVRSRTLSCACSRALSRAFVRSRALSCALVRCLLVTSSRTLCWFYPGTYHTNTRSIVLYVPGTYVPVKNRGPGCIFHLGRVTRACYINFRYNKGFHQLSSFKLRNTLLFCTYEGRTNDSPGSLVTCLPARMMEQVYKYHQG